MKQGKWPATGRRWLRWCLRPWTRLKAKQKKRWLFSGVAAVFVVSASLLVWREPQPTPNLLGGLGYLTNVTAQYNDLVVSVNTFVDRQHKAQMQVVSDQDLQQQLSRVQIDVAAAQFRQATRDMRQLRGDLAGWNQQLDKNVADATAAAAAKAAAQAMPKTVTQIAGTPIPILLYHYPPPNLAQQLDHLEQAHYTVIDLDQALAGLRGGGLPAKPVVITFDDGFANQMQAFALLQQHHMKATFYIINGGAASQWCIGAGRRYGDPLQPPGGCGDAYLNWDQVRTLDQSGLITIGGHTLDHLNLASLSAEAQRHEIIDSKTEIEAQIGHPIRHFAYPYGNYNQTSIQIVQEAGYVTAVTTLPGTYQDPNSPYTLRRVRDAMVLP